MEIIMAKITNILIVTGGNVDVEWTKVWLERQKKDGIVFDYCIAADSGLVSADMLGLKVNYILGDYDSVNTEVLARYRNDVENAVFPREKDYTDTELAVMTAIKLIKDEDDNNGNSKNVNVDEKNDSTAGTKVTIIGATGTRMDHTLANIGLLNQFKDTGIEAVIVDRHNKIQMLSGKDEITINKLTQFGRFISCLPVTPVVTGLTMQGFKYSLDGYELRQGVSIGVSNEITEDEALIKIEEGRMLVFETRD
ncbi:MAG: thiamine diphosphokinase [Bacteroides sp.]